jgi:hypothetical protein
MSPEQIRSKINATPALLALSQARPRDDAAIAAALSVGYKVRDPVTKYTSLGICERIKSLNGLPSALAGEVVLQKLESFAAGALAGNDAFDKLLGAQIKRQMGHLGGAGMAVGSPALTDMLAVVVSKAESGLTKEEADALQDVSAVDAFVTAAEVEAALAPPPATTWTGEILEVTRDRGMVSVRLKFTSSNPGVPPILPEPFVGDAVTPAYINAVIAARCESLQKADAAAALFEG